MIIEVFVCVCVCLFVYLFVCLLLQVYHQHPWSLVVDFFHQHLFQDISLYNWSFWWNVCRRVYNAPGPLCCLYPWRMSGVLGCTGLVVDSSRTFAWYKYQNALRQAIVIGIFSFVKNRSCVTQICITKIAGEMHSGSCSHMTPSCKCPFKNCSPYDDFSTKTWKIL